MEFKAAINYQSCSTASSEKSKDGRASRSWEAQVSHTVHTKH